MCFLAVEVSKANMCGFAGYWGVVIGVMEGAFFVCCARVKVKGSSTENGHHARPGLEGRFRQVTF